MVETTGHGANGLLDADEPAAFAVFNRDGSGRLLLVCDHAAHRVPRRLAGLGLAPARLATHIGWDPGAALVARQLARLLDAPLVLSAYSRLVIDCNRPLQSPESIPSRSDGNQPYPIEDAFDYTLPTHGEARGLPSIMIELRQDGLGTSADCASWAARLAAAWRSLAVG